MLNGKRKVLLAALSGAGLLFAVLAGISERVPWLHAICTGMGDGCKETATYTLFSVPLWIYGVLAYIALGFAVLIRRLQPSVEWLVGVLLGVEAVLVLMMAEEKLLCVYCLGNLLVVLALFTVTFRRESFWRTVSLSLMAYLVSFHFIVSADAGGAAAKKDSEPPQVAARVGSKDITMAELEAPLNARLFDLRRQAHRLKREKLDELILEALLEQEAAARSITVQELIEHEVVSKGIEVNEADVNRYYEENLARLTDWKGSHDELKSRIRSALEQQKTLQGVMDYARTLRGKHEVAEFLEDPVSPYAVVQVGASPSAGPEDAAVTVFEFSDYECPACRQAHEVVRRVREHYGQRIRWVFKDYPLKMHQHSRVAAEAARCVAEQGKFWEYQDLLYGSAEELTTDKLRKLADGLGLDMGLFGPCLDERRHKAAVERDLLEAKKAGLDRTPSFLINGRLITGSHSFERFVQMIDEELNKPRKKP
jgi:protein-disulfide isomerase